MEYVQFNLRLNTATAEALERLAQATHRSRSGVVRWLVLREAEQLAPPVTAPIGDKREVAHQEA